MWVVQMNDQLADAIGVLPTAAADIESLEPVMVEYLNQWAIANEQDLDKLVVHLCLGIEHNHPPYAIVGEEDADGPRRVLLELTAFQLTDVMSNASPLDMLRRVLSAAADDLEGPAPSKTVH